MARVLSKLSLSLSTFGLVGSHVLGSAGVAAAQPAEPLPPPTDPAAPPPLPPATDPLATPPSTAPANPPPTSPSNPPSPSADPSYPPPSGSGTRYSGGTAEPIPPPEDLPKPMSEGRAIVSAWNTGFQWGIAPGIIFSDSKTGFFLGLRLGYGFDTDSVIIVPGVRLAGYFTDPSRYVGMPVMKLVYPIDRFAPFIEGGAGIGYQSEFTSGPLTVPGATGAALLAGGGFMIHFTARFALGAEANYQVITGTGFSGFGVGPIIALAF